MVVVLLLWKKKKFWLNLIALLIYLYYLRHPWWLLIVALDNFIWNIIMKNIIQAFIGYLNFLIACSFLEKKVSINTRNTSLYIPYIHICIIQTFLKFGVRRGILKHNFPNMTLWWHFHLQWHCYYDDVKIDFNQIWVLSDALEDALVTSIFRSINNPSGVIGPFVPLKKSNEF